MAVTWRSMGVLDGRVTDNFMDDVTWALGAGGGTGGRILLGRGSGGGGGGELWSPA